MNFFDSINPYAYAMKLRRSLYRTGVLKSSGVSVPVISIGNLSMGGTGKTPVTLALAKYCIEDLHKKTAIVLRGYKRGSTGLQIVSDGKNRLQEVSTSGDEAQLYTQELSESIVICDEDRIRGAQAAVKLGAEVILLDDGFQHIRLKRDLNILLVNASQGIPSVLPFGKGRETSSAISDVDILLLTNSIKDTECKWNVPSVLTTMELSALDIYSSQGKLVEGMQTLAGKKILALSGIGSPEHFENILSKYAGSIVSYRLPDHAEYDALILERIVSRAMETDCTYIVTTTKDATKMLVLYMDLLHSGGSSIPFLGVAHAEIIFHRGKEILFKKINDLFTS